MLECRLIQEFIHDVGVIYETFCFGFAFVTSRRTYTHMEGSKDATIFFDEVWPKDLQQFACSSYCDLFLSPSRHKGLLLWPTTETCVGHSVSLFSELAHQAAAD